MLTKILCNVSIHISVYTHKNVLNIFPQFFLFFPLDKSMCDSFFWRYPLGDHYLWTRSCVMPPGLLNPYLTVNQGSLVNFSTPPLLFLAAVLRLRMCFSIDTGVNNGKMRARESHWFAPSPAEDGSSRRHQFSISAATRGLPWRQGKGPNKALEIMTFLSNVQEV